MSVLDKKKFINVWDESIKDFVVKPITKEERIELLNTYIKDVGSYELDKSIHLVTRIAESFDKQGRYTNLVFKSKDWVSFWEKEKELCYTGILVEGKFYIPGDYYWYLNYIKINNKVAGKFTFPWKNDMDLYWFQNLEKAELINKFTVTLKARQKGMSLKILAKVLKRWWFEEGYVCRIGTYEDKSIQDNWSILEYYYSHIHKYTGWKRLKTGGKYQWKQEILMKDGTSKGNLSQLQGIVCSKNAAKLVGGKVDDVVLDEAGLFANLDKVVGYVLPALQYGDVMTGNLHIFGAVGELNASKPFRNYFEKPRVNNFLYQKNTFEKTQEEIGLFIPEEWAYFGYIDEFGNSLLEKAIKRIEERALEKKKGSYLDYMIFRSQHPRTPKDAFSQREENIFPTHIIEPWFNWLNIHYKPLKVKLDYDSNGRVHHTFSSKYPVVEDFPINKKTIKHGAVVIEEMPISNPPFGLYYAGVDTVSPLMTNQSISLQSVHIYKAAHEIKGEFAQDKLVAWYCGRPDDKYGAYEISKKLINLYNARAGIENDNKNFIEWMIKEKQQRHIMKRYEFPLAKDALVRSTINQAEYGLRTGNAEMKRYLLSLLIEYAEEEIGHRFDKETGESVPIYGVERIKDKMILKEMLEYSPKKNTDRLISMAIVLFAAKSQTNRGFKIVSKKKKKVNSVYYSPFYANIESPF